MDVRKDLTFDRFGPAPGAPDSHDEHGLDRLSDNTRDITPAVALDSKPEQAALPKDGGMDPAPQAVPSSAMWPNTGPPGEAYDSVPPDSYPVVGSSPRVPEPAEPGWAPVMELPRGTSFNTRPLATC